MTLNVRPNVSGICRNGLRPTRKHLQSPIRFLYLCVPIRGSSTNASIDSGDPVSRYDSLYEDGESWNDASSARAPLQTPRFLQVSDHRSPFVRSALKAQCVAEKEALLESGRAHNASTDISTAQKRGLTIEHLRTATESKTIRAILRAELQKCEVVKDVLRVLVKTMQRRKTAQEFPRLHMTVISVLYRCRDKESDPRILTCLNIIIIRLRMAGLPVSYELYNIGLRFAARSRSLTAMKRYLQYFRRLNLPVDSNLFRSVIAKFSIGIRGLGEIRNGRWKRGDMLQILLGFNDADPNEEPYHLETFLKRDDWEYWHGWVAVLARCRAKEEVWREWDFWKGCEARKRDATLKGGAAAMNLTAKNRGDRWVIEQLVHARDPKGAWEVFKESQLAFDRLSMGVRDGLLEGLQHANVWGEDIRLALEQKCVRDLEKIEHMMGVKWVAGRNDGDGFHTLVDEDLEEVLERLSLPPSTELYGFMDDDDSY